MPQGRPSRAVREKDELPKMRIIARKWTLGGDRIAREGDVIEVTPQLRKTLLFAKAAVDA